MISNAIGQDTFGGVSHAGLTPSPHDISPDGRDAPADVGSTSSATGDLELALEARRREALKRILTQPEYPTHEAVSKPAKPPLNPDSNSMTRRQAHNSQLPINCLPNELLCAIFLVCGDPSPASAFPRDPMMHEFDVNPLEVKSYSKAVVLLGRVCSRWLYVTRGFPALWTLVDVEYPSRKATSILKRCLEYSVDLPLTLWISSSVDPDAQGIGEDPLFMHLVALNAHRWREISIELCDEHHLLRPLIALPPCSFSILSRARIDFWRLDADASTPGTQLWNAWLTSPTLKSVDWVRTQHIRSGLASASLRQLTSIGLHSAEPAMLACVLNTCSELEHLFVSIFPSRFGMQGASPPSLPSPICLPHLRSLILCGPNDWTSLFTALTAPALDRFELSYQDIRSRDIEDMLQRSCARLRMLTVFWPGVNQADHIVSLLRSPPLRHLEVIRYEYCQLGGAPSRGWEDSFDLRPFVPPHVRFTTSPIEADRLYARLENI